MVKKVRVSVKDSISSRPHKSAHLNTKPAVETLNFAPPMTKADEPKAEHHVERVIQPPSEKLRMTAKKSGVDPLKVTMIIVFSIIIAFWSLIFILSIQVSTGPKQVERNITVIYYRSLNLSFQNLIDITDTTYSADTSVLGYLREEQSEGGVLRYILDDNKNRIPATIIAEHPEVYEKLFADTTKQVYNISGTYKYSSGRFIIEIGTLNPTKKPLVEIKEKRLDNITVGDKAGIRINLANGWMKISNAIM